MSLRTTQPRVVLSHSGRQHAYRVASALNRMGALETFLTSAYYKPNVYPDRLARFVPPLDRWLRKRWNPAIDCDRVTRFPLLELPELAGRALGVDKARLFRLVEERDMKFDEKVARLLRGSDPNVFWGFQGSCRHSVEAARANAMLAIVEFASVPTQVSRALLNRDNEGLPHREQAAEPQRSEEYRARVDGEAAAADICIAASTFTATSLQEVGVPRDRIRVIPLGADATRFSCFPRTPRKSLRALFVGKLGRHKGLRYLLQAMRRFAPGSVTLSLAGPSVGDEYLLRGFDVEVSILGSLDGDELHRAYLEHDVLVVPSIYDGFGLVIVEGMATGMPVIATRNSGGPDVIRDGVDGFIVDAFSADAIAERIEWFLNHPAEVREMGLSASQRAKNFTWEAHADRVAAFVADVQSGAVKRK